ncbi:Rha family transcriptional regulator [uncultured Paraglaciecola sp.]|uniref:Rha family transcriptional regulator n=1 Tax=uncultured Paraglaciecola sp. TaxID=1765024 RepID=UPI0026197875|nr:Rha family transcriptional regulator [uncultured Paraglaciecola sp.]
MNVLTLTPQELVSDELTTTSLKVAEVFGKQHKDVLKKIGNVECSSEFNRRNFAPVTYFDAKNEERKSVEMTKDGFIFLVMGFTGKKAAEIKEKYIEAFNWMEKQLSNTSVCVPASPQHRADHVISASRTFGGLLRAAKSMGMDRHRALNAANGATHRATGINLVDELGAADLLEVPTTALGSPRDQLRIALSKWVSEQIEPFTMDDVIEQGLHQTSGTVGRAERTSIGVVLKQLGFVPHKVRVGNGQRYFYRRVN